MDMAQRELSISACDDPLWEPEFLAVLISLLDSNLTAGLAIANCKSINLLENNEVEAIYQGATRIAM